MTYSIITSGGNADGRRKRFIIYFAFVQSLEEKGVAIDPNTLYPLLRRLESQQLLESKWETSGTKPRKYYQRTEYGTQVYEKMKIYWKNLSVGIERLLEEEEA